MDTINYEDFAKEIQQKKEQAPIEHKEAAVLILKEKTQEQISMQQPQPALSSESVAASNSLDDLPSYAKTAPAQTTERVKQLIALTLEKGISFGIAEARNDDPFIIDMYHDALADHIVTKIKEKGLL